MPKFLNWNKKFSRPSVQCWSSAKSGNVSSDRDAASKVDDDLSQTFERLHHICKSSASHPFVKPFGNMVSIVEQAVSGRTAPFPVGPAMNAVLNFLEPSFDPYTRLSFALMVTHSIAATRQFLGEVGGALAVLAEVEDRPGLGSAVKAMLEQWSIIGDTFSQRCRDVWELYTYFAFLDIKGDRTLTDQALATFCELLDLTPPLLSTNLVNSQSSAENVLRGLARKEFQPILEKMHSRFLEEWPCGLLDTTESQCITFWEECFSHTSKVEWTDFLVAFQSFFMGGMLPTDVATHLRFMMDPSCGHHITGAAWNDLLAKHGSVGAVLKVAMGLVLESLATTIYRSDEEIAIFDDEQRSMPGADSNDPDQGTKSIESRRSKSPKEPTNPGSSSSATAPIADATNSAKAAKVEDPSTCVTPPDRLSNHNLQCQNQSKGQRRMTWEEYNTQAQQRCVPWWRQFEVLSAEEECAMEKLRVDATRVVKSSIICTNRALILRILTGSLARNQPILETRASLPQKQAVPSLVVMANGGRENGITTFGRGSSRSPGLSPDHMMSEPIASRSHFNITYDQREQRYCVSDAGSKWGTFLNIGDGRELNCGDWIRAGVAEFVVRHCGGGCSCHKRHAHYRIQSLRLSRQYAGAMLRASSAMLPRCRSHMMDPDTNSEASRAVELQDELALLFTRRQRCGWMPTSTHLCHAAASRSPRHASAQQVDTLDEADENSHHDSTCCAERPQGMQQESVSFTSVPTTPLELEFISGPRMGEKIVLWDRVCTLGRGEQNTIQVCDANIANVSRVHCIFEFVGSRWRIRDNKSTNGTWRRLSCILEPSDPMPLVGGEVLLAGAHEIAVEEVTAACGRRCLPSVATAAIAEMCLTSRTGCGGTNADLFCSESQLEGDLVSP